MLQFLLIVSSSWEIKEVISLTGRREGRDWGPKEKKEGKANLLGKCPRITGQFQAHLIFEVINLNLG